MLTMLLVVFLMMGTASAVVYESTAASDMITPGQYAKAMSDDIPIAGFGLYADNNETLNEVRFTISDADATGVSGSDVARASVYFSSDDIFDGSDVEVGWTGSISIGSPTIVTTDHVLPVSEDGSRYFVVFKTGPGWSDGEAINVSFDAGDSTYILNKWAVTATALVTNTLTADTTGPDLSIDLMQHEPFITEINGFCDDVLSGVDMSTFVITVEGAPVDSIELTPDGFIFGIIDLPLPDGFHTLSVSVEDYAGNLAETEFDLVVDTTPPTVTLDTVEDSQVFGTTFWINGTYADDTLGVDHATLSIEIIDVHSGPFESYHSGTIDMVGASSYNHSVTLPEGEYEVRVFIEDLMVMYMFDPIDPMNNIGEVSASFAVDGTAPIITLESIEDNQIFGTRTDSTVEIVGFCEDDFFGEADMDTLVITLDGTPVDFEDLDGMPDDPYFYYILESLPDGHHTVSVSVADYVGNVAETGTIHFMVDTEAPIITLESIEDNQIFTTSTVDIFGFCEDDFFVEADMDTLVITLDDVPVDPMDIGFMPGDPFFEYMADLPDGPHTVSVSVADYAGNVAETGTIHFMVDTTVPTIVLGTIEDNQAFNTNAIWINGTYEHMKAGANISTLVITLDGTPVDPFYADETFFMYLAESLSDGSHTVSVSVEDYDSNLMETGTLTFNVDTTAPDAITGVTIEDLEGYGCLEVNWDASEASDFYEYVVYISTSPITDVSEMDPYNSTEYLGMEIIGITDGVDYYAAVVAVDGLGNVNNTVTCAGPVRSLDNAYLYLEEGWNLVSVPRRLNDPSRESVFGSDLVFYYNGTGWVTNPATIEPCKGYWVYSPVEDEIKLDFLTMPTDGSAPMVPPSLDLVAGWNMIGHTSSSSLLVEDSLSSIDGAYSNLLTYYPGMGWGRYISPDLSDFESMESGQGYWIFMTEAKTYGAIDNYRSTDMWN